MESMWLPQRFVHCTFKQSKTVGVKNDWEGQKDFWPEELKEGVSCFLMCVYVLGCLGLRRDEWKVCVSWASRRLLVIFFTRAAQSCPVCLRSLLINASVISPEPGWSNPAERSQGQPHPSLHSLTHPHTPQTGFIHPRSLLLTDWILCAFARFSFPSLCSTLRKPKERAPTVALFSGFGICLRTQRNILGYI